MTSDFRRSSRRVFLTGETPPDIAAIIEEGVAELLGGGDLPEIAVEERGGFFVLHVPDEDESA